MSNAANIFDLLLKTPAVSEQRDSGASPFGPTDTGTDLFGDMFQSVLSPTASAPPLASGNSVQVAEGANTAAQPIHHPLFADTPFERFLSTGVADSQASSQSAAVETPANVKAFNDDLAALLPKADPFANESLTQLLGRSPVDLEPGRYRVLDATVSGGRVQLEIAAPDDPDRVISLLMPAQTVAEGRPSTQNPADTRVALNGVSSHSEGIDELLAAVNLKEIEITEAAVEESRNPLNRSVSLLLTGSRGTEPIQFTAAALKHRLQASAASTAESHGQARPTPDNVTGAAIAKGLPETAQAGQRVSINQVGNSARPVESLWTAAQPAANTPPESPMAAAVEAGAGFPTTSRIDKRAQATGWSFETDSPAGKESAAATLNTLHGGAGIDNADGEEILRAQPARFTLPDDIKTLMRPNGQAISIKIEPHNLGPARLYLSEHGGKIRARLVVNTPEAKQLVEGSLDRLTRQLVDADVALESLEVSVSSDGPGSDFFERQPRWARSIRRIDSISDETEPGEVTAPNLWTPPPSQYVGAGGVNVLA